MKKIVISLLLTFSYMFANVNAVVSIVPQESILKQIGGDKVSVTLMVKPGSSPHTYEPKPNQMIGLSKADVYFSIGIDFEETWLPRFANQNKNLLFVDTGKGIHRIAMTKHHHGEENHDEHHDHDDHDDHDEDHEKHADHDEDHDHHEGKKDPHVWLSTKNISVIATNFYETLIKIDPTNKAYYKENFDKFLLHVKSTDAQIKEILKDVPKNTKFMIFHPAWGYFAHDYHLVQVAVEVEGKSPKPKELQHLIHEAKEDKIQAIFTSPEFSDTTAKVLAKELNISVIKISPLVANWSENFIKFAKAIAN